MYDEIREVEWKISVLNDAYSDASSASRKVSEFYQSVQRVKKLMNENIKIDNKPYCKDMMDQVSSSASNASSAVRYKIPESILSQTRSLRRHLNYLYELLRREEEDDD